MKTIRKDALAFSWVAVVIIAVAFAFSTANAQSATITTTMGPGDSSSQVSALQTFLSTDSTIYPEGLVTGYYGDLTVAAVQRYQCKNGIVCSGDVASTGYGRVGPATLAKIRMQLGGTAGGGVDLPPTSFPSTGDVNAPVIGSLSVATTSTSAVIHWSTNEPVRSRVMYATYWPFVYASAQSASDATFDTSSDATITGLAPNTVYYFALESVDASGNLQWDINHSFRTNF